MPIPECDALGFLPPGIHDCTLDEVAARFCRTAHRAALFEALLRWLAAWRAAGLAPPVYIDGGFVTLKPEPPRDIDVIADVSGLDLRDATVVASVRRLLDHDAIAAEYGIEAFPYHPMAVNDFRLWFAYVKPQQIAALNLDATFRKGLLRVAP